MINIAESMSLQVIIANGRKTRADALQHLRCHLPDVQIIPRGNEMENQARDANRLWHPGEFLHQVQDLQRARRYLQQRQSGKHVVKIHFSFTIPRILLLTDTVSEQFLHLPPSLKAGEPTIDQAGQTYMQPLIGYNIQAVADFRSRIIGPVTIQNTCEIKLMPFTEIIWRYNHFHEGAIGFNIQTWQFKWTYGWISKACVKKFRSLRQHHWIKAPDLYNMFGNSGESVLLHNPAAWNAEPFYGKDREASSAPSLPPSLADSKNRNLPGKI
ncbi:hypothetical protein B7463_g5573, partial [Scytalidium lignicola]